MAIIHVSLRGQSELRAFARDVEEAVKRIDGKRFTIFVEREPLATQLPNRVPITIGKAMQFANELIGAHHIRLLGKPLSDGHATGANERAVVQKFVSEMAQVRKPSPRQVPRRSLREEAQIALAQARNILPANRALETANKALGSQSN